MKKLKYLSLLPFLALTSCGNDSIYGNYVFSMGNPSGSHVTISATLSKENYVPITPGPRYEGAKNFYLDIDTPAFLMEDSGDVNLDAALNDEDSFLNTLAAEEKTPFGYWKQGKDTPNGKRILLGIGLFDELFEDEDVLEKFITAYLKDNVFSFMIPVSMKDLELQLTWYGYLVEGMVEGEETKFVDLFNEPSLSEVNWPGKYDPTKTAKENHEARVGTQPTKEEIQSFISIASEHKDVFGDNFAFRTFYTVGIGLTKSVL